MGLKAIIWHDEKIVAEIKTERIEGPGFDARSGYATPARYKFWAWEGGTGSRQADVRHGGVAHYPDNGALALIAEVIDEVFSGPGGRYEQMDWSDF